MANVCLSTSLCEISRGWLYLEIDFTSRDSKRSERLTMIAATALYTNYPYSEKILTRVELNKRT